MVLDLMQYILTATSHNDLASVEFTLKYTWPIHVPIDEKQHHAKIEPAYLVIYHDDDVTLYKAQVVYSAYTPVYTSTEVYRTTGETEAMQFPRYCSKYYCNRCRQNRSHTTPKGQSLQMEQLQSKEHEQ